MSWARLQVGALPSDVGAVTSSVLPARCTKVEDLQPISFSERLGFDAVSKAQMLTVEAMPHSSQFETHGFGVVLAVGDDPNASRRYRRIEGDLFCRQIGLVRLDQLWTHKKNG